MTKRGRVKFTDRAKGYGYIISDDAKGPRDTILFEVSDSTSEFDAMMPGSRVQFEVAGGTTTRRAKKVVKLA